MGGRIFLALAAIMLVAAVMVLITLSPPSAKKPAIYIE